MSRISSTTRYVSGRRSMAARTMSRSSARCSIVSALSHHGTLDVESREGEGTTFTLTFPVSGARAAVGEQA